jgi:hypothetical protein
MPTLERKYAIERGIGKPGEGRRTELIEASVIACLCSAKLTAMFLGNFLGSAAKILESDHALFPNTRKSRNNASIC